LVEASSHVFENSFSTSEFGVKKGEFQGRKNYEEPTTKLFAVLNTQNNSSFEQM
jgi:hypothetical protein